MEKLEDRKLKGTPSLFASKGERKKTRREMRKFLGRYVDFTGMKTNEEVIDGQKGVLLPLIKSFFTATFKSAVEASRKVDLTGKSDFVRKLQISRKLEAWHARRREELEIDRGGAQSGASPSSPEHLVPLEWKYRHQIRWPQEALCEKAHSASDRARDLVERVEREVKTIPKLSTFARGGDVLADEDDADDGPVGREENEFERRGRGEEDQEEESDEED